uniref:Anthranilate phosphoribosyltransferase n=1 Tax=Lygus hesperus TaxID=30085 RepID=A0A0A9X763_LYGHE
MVYILNDSKIGECERTCAITSDEHMVLCTRAIQLTPRTDIKDVTQNTQVEYRNVFSKCGGVHTPLSTIRSELGVVENFTGITIHRRGERKVVRITQQCGWGRLLGCLGWQITPEKVPG